MAKSATLHHLQQLIKHLEWLTEIGSYKEIIKVLPAKIKHFAEEANALDAGEMKDFSPTKRYTLLVCLIHQAAVRTRDFLAEMFIKRIHAKGKEDFEQKKLLQAPKSGQLIIVLSGVLEQLNQEKSNEELGGNIISLFANRDIERLKQECDDIIAVLNDNHYEFVTKYFRTHRHTFFKLMNILRLKTTTNDESLIRAIDSMVEYEDRRGVYLMQGADLRFASEKWRRAIHKTVDGHYLFDRNLYEICVFTYLTREMVSGDITVEDSESYADYRTQLLTWEACKLLTDDYSKETGIPTNDAEFVMGLRQELRDVADEVDKSYRKNTAFLIERGQLIIPKVKKIEQSAAVRHIEEEILQRMPERNLLDILANALHYTNLIRHFGPLSGSDPKLKNASSK